MGLSARKDLEMINSQFDNGFAQGTFHGAKLQSGRPEHWLSVKQGGPPPRGFYPALYREGNMLIMTMLCYDVYTDDNDQLQLGWHEFVGDVKTGEVPRNAVAYMPSNFDIDTLKDVRERFKEDTSD